MNYSVLIFMKLSLDTQPFLKNSHSKFHDNYENPTDDVAAGTKSHTEGRR
jgi:hypothetical protein